MLVYNTEINNISLNMCRFNLIMQPLLYNYSTMILVEQNRNRTVSIRFSDAVIHQWPQNIMQYSRFSMMSPHWLTGQTYIPQIGRFFPHRFSIYG